MVKFDEHKDLVFNC